MKRIVATLTALMLMFSLTTVAFGAGSPQGKKEFGISVSGNVGTWPDILHSVEEGKTFVIDSSGKKFRVKMRLYEIEEILPSYFIRINKSAIANEKRLEHFSVGFSGAVDAVFKSGYKEYVSRRCFAEIKRRYKV